VSAPLRIVILEDHQLTLDGYLSRLKAWPQIQVVGTAMFGSELEPLLEEHQADVVVLDVNVSTAPDSPSPYPILYVIPRLLQRYSIQAVVVVSMLTDRTLIQAVLDAGASGYILKDDVAATRSLGSILQSVANGGVYLSQQAQQKLLRHLPKAHELSLTPRQLEALSLCGAYPDAFLSDLATKMSVSNSTIRNVLSSAYLRLGVSHRAAAIAKARQLGLITPDGAYGEHSDYEEP
jgi:DNA-binding NarL/FixJ family response regulator